MIIRWGRKGLLAGAYTVTFVTAAVTTNYINEVQHRPSHKQEVRHVTPAGVSANTINRAYLRPAVQFEVKYITPVTSVAEIEEIQHGGDSRPSKRTKIYRTEDVYQALIQARHDVTEAIDEGISGHELALRERALEQAEKEVRGRLIGKSAATPKEIQAFVKALQFDRDIVETQDMEALLLILLIDEITDG